MTEFAALVKELATALRRYAGRRPPINIMGGCVDCGTERQGEHRSSCKWVQAQRALRRADEVKR